MTDSAGRSIDARLADWEARLDRLETEEQRPTQEVSEAPAEPAVGGHVLFVPSPSGYALVERGGESPSVGELIELEGREESYAVARVVRSPLPGDARRCAYLELASG